MLPQVCWLAPTAVPATADARLITAEPRVPPVRMLPGAIAPYDAPGPIRVGAAAARFLRPLARSAPRDSGLLWAGADRSLAPQDRKRPASGYLRPETGRHARAGLRSRRPAPQHGASRPFWNVPPTNYTPKRAFVKLPELKHRNHFPSRAARNRAAGRRERPAALSWPFFAPQESGRRQACVSDNPPVTYGVRPGEPVGSGCSRHPDRPRATVLIADAC